MLTLNLYGYKKPKRATIILKFCAKYSLMSERRLATFKAHIITGMQQCTTLCYYCNRSSFNQKDQKQKLGVIKTISG